ncbi:MAG: single-stranded DNA-binding protein [Aeromicrobium sp.]
MDNESEQSDSANSVRIAGRVSGTPLERQLPSGDRVVSFRVVVPRRAAVRRRTRRSVDTVECSAWSVRMRRAALRLGDGADVAVTGELRRSFRRTGAGVTSWVTVDVDQIDRVPPEASG